MPGPHWTLRSNPSKRAPPGPYQSLPPLRAGGKPDGKEGTLLSAVENLGTRKARRVANLAYAAELAKTSPQVELGCGDDARAQTARRRTDRAGAGINEARPDQANCLTVDLQAQMADMAATLSTSVKTLAQSLELKQANQFF